MVHISLDYSVLPGKSLSGHGGNVHSERKVVHISLDYSVLPGKSWRGGMVAMCAVNEVQNSAILDSYC